ncbi:glycerophosphodiester phosphodiesterase family protein [Roseiarcaceae bacterium H3SJ34-1]|uniref:glycerophosphodiester phosphodiesterase family protein n=1 Tax=Terripilifer ovatus TaxID=3032367 RepID=UPI003AB92E53|nr:glycerophosphodiester phosphodiesterase family protein [Roseiarcaceae bacterium H3SJ34-1]
MTQDLSWLVSRPIAHRGLHDEKGGIVENSLTAARRAVASNYGVECDVQMSADGEVFVFHDFTLERLTDGQGKVADQTAVQLAATGLRGGGETIPTLAALLDVMGADHVLVIEIKSAFTGDMRLAERTAKMVASHPGRIVLKSFDPQVMAHLRLHRDRLGITGVPLGMVAEAHYDDAEWGFLGAQEKRALANFLHWNETRPEFLSYWVNDFPHAVPHLLRRAVNIPVITWTVRTPAQFQTASLWADQIVFENWMPD